MVLCNFARTNPSQMAERVGEIWLEDRMEPQGPQEADRENPRPRARPDTGARVLSPEEANALTGEFHSPELNATYRIFLRDGDLTLDVDGVLALPLEAVGQDTLVAGGWLTLTYAFSGSPVVGFQASSGRVEGVTFVRR
jgi:hypothetical protein